MTRLHTLVFPPASSISHSFLFTLIMYFLVFWYSGFWYSVGWLVWGIIHACPIFCVPLWVRVTVKLAIYFALAVFLNVCFMDHLHQNCLGCLLKGQASKPHPRCTESASLWLQDFKVNINDGDQSRSVPHNPHAWIPSPSFWLKQSGVILPFSLC